MTAAPFKTVVLLLALLAAGPLAAKHNPIAAASLSERLDGADAPLILDVRTKWEYQSGHVPGAVNIPYDELASRVATLPAGKQQPIVVYCESGPRAFVAEDILLNAGFTMVQDLAGHMANWRAKGYPMSR